MTAESALDTIECLLKQAPRLWERGLDAPERQVNQAISDALSTIGAYRFAAQQTRLAAVGNLEHEKQ